MPPILALVLTVLLIGYLFVRDFKKEPRPSNAIWIPTLWLLIVGSRQVSQWLGTGTSLAAQRLEEGSPVDQAVFGALMCAGMFVLASRRARVGEIVRNNLFVVLFILYEGISFIWSDFPGIALRRWIKALGDPIMVLVVLSDPFPARAIVATISRCAYVMIPLSVLFCKYYENLGRAYDAWGNSGYSGVTLDKNMLGYLLFAFGLFFVAALMSTMGQSTGDRRQLRSERIVSILFLAMIWWLLSIAHSSTALVAVVAGSAVVVALRFTSIRKYFWYYAVVLILVAVIFNTNGALQNTIAEAAGREATLTGRTGIWETVLEEPINPLIGVGYSTFWIGERLARMWARYPNTPLVQAHNGYIEVYLNLGLLGLSLVACILWSGLRKMKKSVALSFSTTTNDRLVATFALSYGLTYLLYNITEATFAGGNFLFITFLILACGDPGRVQPKPTPLAVARTSKFAGVARQQALSSPKGQAASDQRRRPRSLARARSRVRASADDNS